MAGASFSGYHTPRQVVSVTLPRFYEEKVGIWLMTVENVFRLKGIASEAQKYELAVGALDFRHLERLEHVLSRVGMVSPYTELKNEICRIFSPSRERDFEELLYHVELGDRSPTELLFRMKKLLGHESPVLLEKLFKDRLPEEVRRAIVTAHHVTLMSWRVVPTEL